MTLSDEGGVMRVTATSEVLSERLGLQGGADFRFYGLSQVPAKAARSWLVCRRVSQDCSFISQPTILFFTAQTPLVGLYSL